MTAALDSVHAELAYRSQQVRQQFATRRLARRAATGTTGSRAPGHAAAADVPRDGARPTVHDGTPPERATDDTADRTAGHQAPEARAATHDGVRSR